jgi:hypothetical protein
MRNSLLLLVATLLLTGCKIETASILIQGRETAVTLERVKDYFWSSEWDLYLVVRRNPECQRRHKLKPAPDANFKVEVYTPEPFVFIVKQGKRWYVTELMKCEMQPFKEEPPVPGKLLGSFRVKDGELRYIEGEGGK